MIPFFGIALSRLLRPFVVRLATKDLEEKYRAQDRQSKIDRLVGGANIDAAVELALVAAEAAIEQFCRDNHDEYQHYISGRLNAEERASWSLRFRAAEAAGYNRALAEARAAGLDRLPKTEGCAREEHSRMTRSVDNDSGY
jgi:hypothetical protein